MLFDKTNIGKNVTSFEVSPEFDGYSKVIINVTDEISYEAGNDDGRTLELDCPWGTQQMARNILTGLAGFQYQPYSASGAFVDPSAEVGDGISVNGIYSGLFSQTMDLDGLCVSEIRAPYDEEIDHEYEYVSETQRKITRKFEQINSEFAVQADNISAKVSRTGGDNTSFGWMLTEDGFILASNGREMFRADNTGITVKGKVQADTGYIGGESGFVIKSGKIYSNNKETLGSQNQGIYIGTDGISIGTAFKVTSGGALTATSGKFGSISVSNGSCSGSLSGSFYGSSNGSFSGTGALKSDTTYGGQNLATYIDSLVANKITANYINSMFSTSTILNANMIDVKTVMYYQSHTVYRGTIKDADGLYQNVLKW